MTGDPLPPNENYARELLQIFSMGTVRLNMDGTPVLDGQGNPIPNYTEADIKEIARALTGWQAGNARHSISSRFRKRTHDARDKTIFGRTITGRKGKAGALEVEDVVGLIMEHPSVPPFISKELIQRLATETPTPGYVERVATVFKQTNGDIKATVRAILLDPEFTSDAVVGSQFKEPIELILGPIRALEGTTYGYAPIGWARRTRQLVYHPPSVFGFYRPGEKSALVNDALALARDQIADEFASDWDASGFGDTHFDAAGLMARHGLDTPERIVDFLADALLAAPLDPRARAEIVAHFNGEVNETKFRGAVWLILCLPDYQRN
jgi:uncharacterized protein (DUF1800 family)